MTQGTHFLWSSPISYDTFPHLKPSPTYNIKRWILHLGASNFLHAKTRHSKTRLIENGHHSEHPTLTIKRKYVQESIDGQSGAKRNAPINKMVFFIILSTREFSGSVFSVTSVIVLPGFPQKSIKKYIACGICDTTYLLMDYHLLCQKWNL